MTLTTPQPKHACPDWNIPEPILFNCWKHHAGVVCQRIANAIEQGKTSLTSLAESLKCIGSSLMDFYTGELPPDVIAEKVLAHLSDAQALEKSAFIYWLQRQEDYAVLTFPEDESCWVLRLADEQERFIHLHPGRWTPHTMRVRSNVLKTAIMVLAHCGITGNDPLSLTAINNVREQYLKLSPIAQPLDTSTGLGEMIQLLNAKLQSN